VLTTSVLRSEYEEESEGRAKGAGPPIMARQSIVPHAVARQGEPHSGGALYRAGASGATKWYSRATSFGATKGSMR
jgi:hypothetical protein